MEGDSLEEVAQEGSGCGHWAGSSRAQRLHGVEEVSSVYTRGWVHSRCLFFSYRMSLSDILGTALPLLPGDF